MWPIWETHQDPKLNTDQRVFWQVLLEFAVNHFDPATGQMKQPMLSPGPYLRILPLFPCREFADQSDLISAMNAAGQMVWFSGPDNHNVHVNPWLEAWTGRQSARYRDRDWLEFLHPQDRERIITESLTGFATLKPYTTYYRLRFHDGVYYRVVDHAQPVYLRDSGFAGYVGSIYMLPEAASVVQIEGNSLVIMHASPMPPSGKTHAA